MLPSDPPFMDAFRRDTDVTQTYITPLLQHHSILMKPQPARAEIYLVSVNSPHEDTSR